MCVGVVYCDYIIFGSDINDIIVGLHGRQSSIRKTE
jgi:hypothetical protein